MSSEIVLEKLNKSFVRPDLGGVIDVLNNVSLTIHPGEFLSIIGASGCGKSTLLRMIAGLDFPTDGDLLFNKSEITGPDSKRGLVFQDPTLFPWLTVEQNIAFGLKSRRVRENRKERVDEFIDIIGLTEFKKSFPHQLSGGMAQRVSLARALINEPEVLLLDEPLGALDAFTRMNMQDEILRLWEQQKNTMILITHDVDEAVYLSDRIIIMSPRPGRIRQEMMIEISRPRNRSDPDFIHYRTKILEILNFSKEVNQDYYL